MVCMGNFVKDFYFNYLIELIFPGNICRSPMAEAILQDIIEKAGESENWSVESAAIGCWDVGNPINYRAANTMKRHNLNYNRLKRARRISKEDFLEFDYIFGMDPLNMEDLKKLTPQNSKAKCLMLGDFGLDEAEKIIEDPYRVSLYFLIFIEF